MLKLFCDNCSQEITELCGFLEGLRPESVNDIVEILEGLEEQLLMPKSLEVFEETVAAVGIGREVLKLCGLFYCANCVRDIYESGRLLPNEWFQ